MCTVDRRLSILRRVPFVASVAAEDIAAINGQFHERGYAAGETIYMAGDIAARLYVVAVGRVKVHQRRAGAGGCRHRHRDGRGRYRCGDRDRRHRPDDGRSAEDR
jgi:CRP-like cAMP-binding protein